MNVFRSLQLAASAPVARERLQILLEYERKLVHASGIEGLIFWLRRLCYPARGFPA